MPRGSPGPTPAAAKAPGPELGETGTRGGGTRIGGGGGAAGRGGRWRRERAEGEGVQGFAQEAQPAERA